MSDDQPIDFLRSIPDLDRYEPFNLVLGHGAKTYHINSIEQKLNTVGTGIHALSNEDLNTPWPKAEATRAAIDSRIGSEVIDLDSLFVPLTDRTMYPDEMLPSTGVPLEWERILSAAFVEAPGYGTRCSTVALHNAEGWVLQERVWDRVS